MNGVALTLKQLRYESKAFWRNPAAAFFTFVFPLMFLFIFNGLDVGPSEFYVPSIAAFSVITACYTNLAMSMTILRDEGVLKRMRGTPLPAWAYVLARVLHATFVAILLVLIVTAVGALIFDVDPPTDAMAPLVVSVIVGAASFCSLALAFTSLIPNPDAAPPMVNFMIIPLAFISGIFLPPEQPPEWLQTVADLFPLKHYAQTMLSAFLPTNGSAWEPDDLLVVGGWGLAGLLLAVRFFSWEPRR